MPFPPKKADIPAGKPRDLLPKETDRSKLGRSASKSKLQMVLQGLKSAGGK